MGKSFSRGARAPLLAALTGATLLSGCASPIPFEAPNMRLSDRYSVVVPVVSTTGHSRWWEGFRDPVLNRLIEEAGAGNLSLAEAEARIREAEAELRRSGQSVSGDGRLDLQRSEGSESGRLSLSALFDPFGVGKARRKSASARLDAARLSEIDARRRLMGDIAETYIDMRFFQQSVAERSQDLRSRRLTLRDITTQSERGAATELDVLRAKALVAETEAEIPGLEARAISARNRLSTLVGVPVGHLPADMSYTGHQPAPPRLSDVGVPADLLRNRPDIRQAERLYAAAVSDMDQARASRYPRLSLSGSIQAPLSGGGGTVESLGAGLTLPIFDQPALAAGVDAAEARASQAYLQWRAAVLQAVEEVETALVELQGGYRSVDASRRVVNLNQDALALSRKLLENRGDITMLDLFDQERTLTDARASLSRNQRDLAVSYVRLRVALASHLADPGETVPSELVLASSSGAQ